MGKGRWGLGGERVQSRTERAVRRRGDFIHHRKLKWCEIGEIVKYWSPDRKCKSGEGEVIIETFVDAVNYLRFDNLELYLCASSLGSWP